MDLASNVNRPFKISFAYVYVRRSAKPGGTGKMKFSFQCRLFQVNIGHLILMICLPIFAFMKMSE